MAHDTPQRFLARLPTALAYIDEAHLLRPPNGVILAEADRLLQAVPTLVSVHNAATLIALLYYRWAQVRHPGKLVIRPFFREVGIQIKGYYSALAKIKAAGYRWGPEFTRPADSRWEAFIYKLTLIEPDSSSLPFNLTKWLVQKYGGEIGSSPAVRAAVGYTVAQKLLKVPDPILAYRVANLVGCSTSSVYVGFRRFLETHSALVTRYRRYTESAEGIETDLPAARF